MGLRPIFNLQRRLRGVGCSSHIPCACAGGGRLIQTMEHWHRRKQGRWFCFSLVQTKVSWRTLLIIWYSRPRLGIKVQSCPVLR